MTTTNTTNATYIVRPVDESEVPAHQSFGGQTGRPRLYDNLAELVRENPGQWYWVVTGNAKTKSTGIQTTLRKRYGLRTTTRRDARKPEGFYIKLVEQPVEPPEDAVEVAVG